MVDRTRVELVTNYLQSSRSTNWSYRPEICKFVRCHCHLVAVLVHYELTTLQTCYVDPKPFGILIFKTQGHIQGLFLSEFGWEAGT